MSRACSCRTSLTKLFSFILPARHGSQCVSPLTNSGLVVVVFDGRTNSTGPFAYLTAYFLSPRLHFAVPGGGCDDDGDRGSDRPRQFRSRQEDFLDFVALSKWLLEQLGGGVGVGVGGYAGFESAATDTPVAVCADILKSCQVCPLASLGWLISTAGRS